MYVCMYIKVEILCERELLPCDAFFEKMIKIIFKATR